MNCQDVPFQQNKGTRKPSSLLVAVPQNSIRNALEETEQEEKETNQIRKCAVFRRLLPYCEFTTEFIFPPESHDDGDSMILRNVGTNVQVHTMSQPGRSTLREPQIMQCSWTAGFHNTAQHSLDGGTDVSEQIIASNFSIQGSNLKSSSVRLCFGCWCRAASQVDDSVSEIHGAKSQNTTIIIMGRELPKCSSVTLLKVGDGDYFPKQR
jgi:hypothetical protein